MKYTLYGDTNLDEQVNLIDFNKLSANFGNAGNWAQGDTNYDGQINLLDFNKLAANFGLSLDDVTGGGGGEGLWGGGGENLMGGGEGSEYTYEDLLAMLMAMNAEDF